MEATSRKAGGGLRRLIDDAAATLAGAGVENPRFDAELLMAQAAGVSRAALLANFVTADDCIEMRYAELIRRRAAREPAAYILGHREFYSLEFEVSPAVLIPRPETETLVETAIKFIAAFQNCRVLDLGTGSGAIALAIAANAPAARVVATDVSATALEVAHRNTRRLGLDARVELRRADCFKVIDGGSPLGRFDLIVSNPPYVREGDLADLQPEIGCYEPHIALAGGADGPEFYRRITHDAPGCLAPGGALMVEIGAGEAPAVAALFRAAGLARVRLMNDLGGNPRVIASVPDLW
jgi:release factor glutamine methyltransferase